MTTPDIKETLRAASLQLRAKHHDSIEKQGVLREINKCLAWINRIAPQTAGENRNAIVIGFEKVCGYYLMTEEQLKSGERTEVLLNARSVLIYYLRNKVGLTLQGTAACLNRNHPAVNHHLKHRLKYYGRDARWVSDYEKIFGERLTPIAKKVSRRRLAEAGAQSADVTSS